MFKKKPFTITIISALVLLIILGVLSLIIKSVVIGAILHAYLRLLLVFAVVKLLSRFFKEELINSAKKAFVLCGCALFLDLVVIDAVRFVLSNGISTVLFLPACVPVCFMIIMHYSTKDTGKDKKDERRLTYIVGIPLLILSLCFEIASFVSI